MGFDYMTMTHELLCEGVASALGRICTGQWALNRADATDWKVTPPEHWLGAWAPCEMDYRVQVFGTAIVIRHSHSDAGCAPETWPAPASVIDVQVARRHEWEECIFLAICQVVTTCPPNLWGFT